jgi:hypothetical protein
MQLFCFSRNVLETRYVDLPAVRVDVRFRSIINRIVSTTVDTKNMPMRRPDRMKTFFFNDDFTGVGPLQGKRGSNV